MSMDAAARRSRSGSHSQMLLDWLFLEVRMAEPASILDTVDPDVETQAIAHAEAEIDAGRGVPHARVREWLAKLAKGEIEPPPTR